SRRTKAYAETGSSAIRRSAGRNLRAAREAYSSRRLGRCRIPWRSGHRRNGLRQRGSWQAAWPGLLVLLRVSVQRFDGQRDALTAADAKRDEAARETVAAHRVDQLGRQHRTGGADRMAMGHGAAFDVDDVLGQPELARDNDGDGGAGLIDLGALDGANTPAGALQGLLDRRHGSQSEHARCARGDAVRDQACDRGKTVFVGPRAVGEHHGRSGVVQSGGVAGGDFAVWTEGRLEPGQRFERRVGAVVLVLVEMRRALFAWYFHPDDLGFVTPVGLRGGEALLRSQSPTGPRPARDLVFLDQILGLPAGVRVRESVVQSVAQHAVIERAIAHAVAPATAGDEIRRLVHVLHAARDRDVDVVEGDLLRRRDNGLRS